MTRPIRQSTMVRHKVAASFMLVLSVCWTGSVKAQGDDEPEVLEEAIMTRIDGLADRLLDDAQVERARNRLLRYHYTDLQSLSDRADLLSQFTTYFDAPEAVAREIERYEDVTAEDIRQLAARYLGRDQRAVVTVPTSD